MVAYRFNLITQKGMLTIPLLWLFTEFPIFSLTLKNKCFPEFFLAAGPKMYRYLHFIDTPPPPRPPSDHNYLYLVSN